VIPDLVTLAKILAGGYPGAALAGRADVMRVLDYRRRDDTTETPMVAHQGTYNAGPVSAAAGVATLAEVSRGEVIGRANRAAAAIRDGINAAIKRRGLNWCAFGLFSDFHLYRGDETPEEIHAGKARWQVLKGGIPLDLVMKIRAGFLLHGVDVAAWPGGFASAAHTDEDVARTVAAFEGTFDMLADEGAL
jgi:glutamate-1-semialdehyde 2,1-aminomutase